MLLDDAEKDIEPMKHTDTYCEVRENNKKVCQERQERRGWARGSGEQHTAVPASEYSRNNGRKDDDYFKPNHQAESNHGAVH